MTIEILNKLKIYADAFNQIRAVLNEREHRIFLAETAVQFGYGSLSVLSQRTGVAISTIRRAIDELSSQELPDDGRICCAGAGRKPVEEIYRDVETSYRKSSMMRLTVPLKAAGGHHAACKILQKHCPIRAFLLKRVQFSES